MDFRSILVNTHQSTCLRYNVATTVTELVIAATHVHFIQISVVYRLGSKALSVRSSCTFIWRVVTSYTSRHMSFLNQHGLALIFESLIKSGTVGAWMNQILNGFTLRKHLDFTDIKILPFTCLKFPQQVVDLLGCGLRGRLSGTSACSFNLNVSINGIS